MKLKLLSVGNNSKLSKAIGVFNLPQGITCPGKTAVCSKICYALKAERMYKAAAAMRQRNLDATQTPGFVTEMLAELKYCVEKKGLSKIRWHESGDAYSQKYLKKIFEVCRESPEVTFLMYTKSFHLSWVDKPANLMVYWSIDSSTHVPVPAGPTATIVLKGEQPPKGAVTCVHANDSHYCGSECVTCWLGVKDVYFDQH
jgi:hypothetical protein